MPHYEIAYRESFEKQFKKLDPSVQRTVLKYIKTHLDQSENPFAKGKALVGDEAGFWRYRIGDYRLIVETVKLQLVIDCLHAGYRREAYRINPS